MDSSLMGEKDEVAPETDCRAWKMILLDSVPTVINEKAVCCRQNCRIKKKSAFNLFFLY